MDAKSPLLIIPVAVLYYVDPWGSHYSKYIKPKLYKLLTVQRNEQFASTSTLNTRMHLDTPTITDGAQGKV